MSATYICPNCGIDYGYPQGLQIHEELGCDWVDDNDDDGTKYCCGMIYEDGEFVCASCGESL